MLDSRALRTQQTFIEESQIIQLQHIYKFGLRMTEYAQCYKFENFNVIKAS